MKRRVLLAAVLTATSAAFGQIANPADNARSSAADAKSTVPPITTAVPSQRHVRTYEMPAVEVVGEPTSSLREEERIGSYNQPRWTATRRFPGTRVYVVPEGKIEAEYWLRPTFNKNGSTDIRSLYELEIGLPYRMQLDLYLRTDRSMGHDVTNDDTLLGEQIELRYALADWGKIWGNPTLYFEYLSLEDRPDKIEPKLLLGGELAEGWHWGVNFVLEQEMGGARESEWEVTWGVSKTLEDSRFSIGLEGQHSFITEKGDRNHYYNENFVGPSLQYKPFDGLTINLVPMVGFGDAGSPKGRVYLNVGYEF